MKCTVADNIKVLMPKGKRKVGTLMTSNSTNLEKAHEHIHMNE